MIARGDYITKLEEEKKKRKNLPVKTEFCV
jgi:hypothetical protein